MNAVGGTGAPQSREFMKLLTTQLSNQNPLEPMQDTEFMAQLAQFSQIEEAQAQTGVLQQIALGMQTNNILQGLAQASGLIDKPITYLDGDFESQGVVKGVRFADGGIVLELGDKEIPLGNIVAVGSTGAGPDDAVDAETGADDEDETETDASA